MSNDTGGTGGSLSPEALSAARALATFRGLREALERLADPPSCIGATAALLYLLDKAVTAFGGREEALRVLGVEVERYEALCRLECDELFQRTAA
jgi:hypothetical protein